MNDHFVCLCDLLIAYNESVVLSVFFQTYSILDIIDVTLRMINLPIIIPEQSNVYFLTKKKFFVTLNLVPKLTLSDTILKIKC